MQTWACITYRVVICLANNNNDNYERKQRVRSGLCYDKENIFVCADTGIQGISQKHRQNKAELLKWNSIHRFIYTFSWKKISITPHKSRCETHLLQHNLSHHPTSHHTWRTRATGHWKKLKPLFSSLPHLPVSRDINIMKCLSHL